MAAGLDLPTAALVWSSNAQTMASYLDPTEFATRWDLDPEQVRTADDLDEITDVVINR